MHLRPQAIVFKNNQAKFVESQTYFLMNWKTYFWETNCTSCYSL